MENHHSREQAPTKMDDGSRPRPPCKPKPTTPASHKEIHVHGLTAKVFLNQPVEDLIPVNFLEKADRSHIVLRDPWVFRAGVEDARNKNLSKWSDVDIRFRGVFKTLQKVPKFKKGLYDDEETELGAKKVQEAARFQGQVVYALLDEILNMLNIKRETVDNNSFFRLVPRLLTCQMEYWTGYRERHQDAPFSSGFVSLDFHPEEATCEPILPVSTTTQPQSLKSALEGKFKLILSQLLLHIHLLHPPADKFPSQETFLIGLHGSRLHIFRVYFPGQKTSQLWCGRHISSQTSLASGSLALGKYGRFYTTENLERIAEEIERKKLSSVDGDPDPRTFRLLATKEYDLWVKSDFQEAVRALVGLIYYLMSGKAQCGVLQKAFKRFPYDEDGDPQTEEQQNNQLEELAKEQMKVERKEKKLENKEKSKREEDDQRFRTREAMRFSAEDHISGFNSASQPWWDWVWEDPDADPPAQRDDADLVILGA